MEENTAIEIFKLIMSGGIKQGFDLAADKLELKTADFEQLLKMYAENPNMTDEELRNIYHLIKEGTEKGQGTVPCPTNNTQLRQDESGNASSTHLTQG